MGILFNVQKCVQTFYRKVMHCMECRMKQCIEYILIVYRKSITYKTLTYITFTDHINNYKRYYLFVISKYTFCYIYRNTN